MEIKIGFIGQGWIGKHYADEFEARMYAVVRYSLEEPYIQNKDLIKDCAVVFIAVPTPTTEEGFDDSIVRDALTLVGKGKIAVIKSTLLPGTTEKLQSEFKEIFVLHSPEFLVEATAAYDAAKPQRNLVGIPIDSPEYTAKAEAVLRILPEAPYAKIMSARDAEMVKYAGNCFLYTKVLYMNMLYDLTQKIGCNWEVFREALIHDARIGESHTQPVHASGHDVDGHAQVKRGAGGHCLIKDFEALRMMYKDEVASTEGDVLLKAMVELNNKFLIESGKDLDLLKGVYGSDFSVK
jgi:nucleotide sugar dehydrogenase